MVEKYTIRTDLAMEQKERFESDHVEVSGVVLEEEYDEEREIKITTVRIETENGAKMMGKPVGTYLTLEVPDMASADDGYHREISETLAGFLEKYVENEETKKEHSKEKGCSILTVGLGNREVTPDALGPRTLSYVLVTRHLIEQMPEQFSVFRPVSALAPGVLGTTGLESVEVVRGVIAHAEPTRVIVVDALASRDPARVCSTIQLADSGIVPGSGIGNSRQAFNQQTLGVPVVAVGVPTVVDAATLVTDYLERNGLKAPKNSLRQGLVVTPSDIDAKIGRIVRILGLGISRALHPELTIGEIQNCMN